MSYDVFISYNSQDHEAVEKIARKLHDRGITAFLDRWYLPKGQPWRSLLEQNLANSGSAAVFIGPNGMGPWQHREIDVALNLQTTRGAAFPVIPVLLPGCEPPLGFLGQSTWIDRRNQPLEQVVQLLEKSIRGEPPGPELEAQFVAAKSAVCPYRGLLYFREEDAPFFFGRDAAIDELHQAVEKSSFVAVVGASGSGKSSVVRAGLVPRLRKDRQDVWEIAVLVPGDEPLKSLAAALVPFLYPELDAIERRAKANQLATHFGDGSISLRDIVRDVLERQTGTQRLLLIADQWEELYTLTKDDAQHRRFVDEMLDASTRAPLSVVLTLRGDFVGSALAYRSLSDRLQGAQINLGPMTVEELELAIRSPAKEVGLEFESGLSERILSDVGEEPGHLPLLEFVLRELWDKRQGGQLLHNAYNRMGGLHGAVAAKAEALFEKLSAPEQQAMRQLFLRLVHASEEGNDTRRREMLCDIPGLSHWLVREMTDERLLVTNGNSELGGESVEVAHEALIRHWKRLTGWLNSERDFLLWKERLRSLLEVWERGNHNSELLLRGPVLAEAEGWLRWKDDNFTDGQRRFIRSSIDQKLRELEREEKKARRLRRLVFATGLLAVAAIVAAMAASYQTSLAVAEQQRAELATANALRAQRESEARRLLSEARITSALRPERAVLLLAEALKLKPEPLLREIQKELLGVMAQMPGIPLGEPFEKVTCMTTSADGCRIAAGRSDGKIALLDFTQTNPSARLIHTSDEAIASISISPNNKWIAVATGSNIIVHSISDPASPEVAQRFMSKRNSKPSALSFGDDSSVLASGYSDGELRFWDISDHEFSENKLANSFHQIISDEGTAINSLVISLDNRWILAGYSDGWVRKWTLNETSIEAGPTKLYQHAGPVKIAQRSPDGRFVATGGEDQTVWISEISKDGNPLQSNSLSGHDLGVAALAFCSDKSELITASKAGEVRFWNIAGEKISAAQFPVLNVSKAMDMGYMHANDRIFVNGDWDLQRQQALKSIYNAKINKDLDQSSAFKMRLEDSARLGLNLPGRPSAPTGLRVLSSDAATFKFNAGGITTLAVNYNEGLAIGDLNGSTTFMKLSDPGSTRTFKGHYGWVCKTAFGPKGESMISTSWDGRIRLWPVPGVELLLSTDKHKNLGRALTTLRSLVNQYALSEGRELNAVDSNGLIGLARDLCGRNLTEKEWRTHFPERPYSKTFDDLPIYDDGD